MKNNLCPKCGCDLDVWREVFNEEHHCHTQTAEEQEKFQKTVAILRPLFRQMGIQLWTVDQLTDKELDKQVKGWG